jgi:hypothetical protein
VRILLRTVTVSLLVLSLGLHWALLQTVAWTGMLVTYSRDASIEEAVSKTFDGAHPCPLCKVIKKCRAEESRQEQQQVKPGFKLDAAPIWQSTEFDFVCGHHFIPSGDRFGLSRADEPPKPRPRFA